jgi:hypothetical protein
MIVISYYTKITEIIRNKGNIFFILFSSLVFDLLFLKHLLVLRDPKNITSPGQVYPQRLVLALRLGKQPSSSLGR